jgi:hypothetical protein
VKNSVFSVLTGAIVFTTILVFTPATAKADVDIVLAAPAVCQWGYYDYPPYTCAQYGFWGPEFFYNGIFIGVGPWWGWGYGHGWGGHRFHGYYNPGHAYGHPGWDTRGRYEGGYRRGYDRRR